LGVGALLAIKISENRAAGGHPHRHFFNLVVTGFTNILTNKNKSFYYQYVMSSLLDLGPAVFAMGVIRRRAHKKQRAAQADADDAADDQEEAVV
jgi:hypothetical protein